MSEGIRGGRRIALAIAIAAALAALVPAIVLADGGLDQTFSQDGKVTKNLGGEDDAARDVAITSEGKVLVAVEAEDGGDSRDFFVLRYTAGGRLDHHFSGDGIAFAHLPGFASPQAMALQPDGRIVVVGDDVQEGINFNFAVARFMPDGRLDQSFSGDGRRVFPFVPGDEIDGATDVAILENGKIVLAGYSGGFGNGLDVALARLTPNGAFDKGFGDDGRATTPLSPSTDRISSLAVQDDGKLVASGLIADGGETRFLVARFRAGGSLDTSFDGGFVITDFPDDVVGEADIANAVGIQRNGRIVAAGYTGNQFGGATEVAIARYLENGTPDDDFDDDGMQTFDFVPAAGDQAQDLAITGRKIMTAGFTASVGPTGNDWQLLRVLPDGSLDESWAGDGSRTTDFGSANDFANAIAVRDGKVVAAGYTGPSDQVVALARYRG